MDRPLAYALVIVIATALGIAGQWSWNQLRAARTRKYVARASEFARENGPALGEQMRLELGSLSPAELERFWIELTNFIAATGLPAGRDVIVLMLASARRASTAAPTDN